MNNQGIGGRDSPPERNTIVIEDPVLRAGFTKVPNLLLTCPGLTHGAKLAYALLLSYAWQEGSCFPGQEKLGVDLGVERKAVVRYLKELKDKGFINVERRGLGLTNIYKLPSLADVPFLGHQEVPSSGQPEVPSVGHKKDSVEKDSERRIYNSKLRNTSRSKISQDTDENREVDQAQTTPEEDNPVISWLAREDSKKRPTRAPIALGDLLTQRFQETSSVGNPASQNDQESPDTESAEVPSPNGARIQVPAQIRDMVESCATEFHDDEGLLLSNLTRGMNLYHTSGLSEYGFCRVMEESRRATLQAGNIKKSAKTGSLQGLKNRMPYFWSVVQNRLDELRVTEQADDEQSSNPPS